MEHAAVAAQLVDLNKRTPRLQPVAGGLLECDRPQLGGAEHGAPCRDAGLDALRPSVAIRRSSRGRHGGTQGVDHLAIDARLQPAPLPHAVQLAAIARERLALARAHGQVAQLAPLRLAPMLRAELARRALHLLRASREGALRLFRDPADAEVAAVLTRRLDRVAELAQLAGEVRPVEGADLARRAQHRPRADCRDRAVLALDARQHDVAVQLRVGRLLADATRGRVHERRGMHVRGTRRNRRARRRVVADRQLDGLAQVADGRLDRRVVRGLERSPLVAERPRDAYALRRAERDVDPARACPVRAGSAQPDRLVGA